jgi:DNA-binding transcriptional regulator YiaG
MTQQELIQRAKTKCKLSNKELAEYLNLGIHALRSWQRPSNNKAYRVMPRHMFDYIELKIKAY